MSITNGIHAPTVLQPPPANEPAVEIQNLTFDLGGPTILDNLSLTLPHGSRTLLIGGNGAGKSTLLRLLAGKRLVKNGKCHVLSKRAFFEAVPGLTYLGTEWAANPIVRGDVQVSQLLKSAGMSKQPERAKELLEVMDVNPEWHMNAVSDGERRRVQIVLGLLEPWYLLLLDEVTVDLDVVVRTDLLAFLARETERRPGASILYATHIYDGLGEWPTHVAHMTKGNIAHLREVNVPGGFPEMESMLSAATSSGTLLNRNSPLLTVVHDWLRADLIARRAGGQTFDAGHDERGFMGSKKFGLVERNPMDYYNYWGGKP